MSWPSEVLTGSKVVEELRRICGIQLCLESRRVIEIELTPVPSETSSNLRQSVEEQNILERLEKELKDGGVLTASVTMAMCSAFGGGQLSIFVSF